MKPRKQLGQHFLNAPAIIHRIMSAIQPATGEHIVEIGPGQGALTLPLLTQYSGIYVSAIEIDRDLVALLQAKIQKQNKQRFITIYPENVLTFDFSALTLLSQPLKIIGNLPYNISTSLLFYLLKYKNAISEMIFMLQKEVVDRLCATVGTKNYGRLSVMLQYHFDMDFLFDVPPDSFYPVPKVDSAMIRFRPKKNTALLLTDEAQQWFGLLVQEAFQYRRKTLKNALKKYMTDIQHLTDIDFSRRPESLSVQEYVFLANGKKGNH